MAIEPDPGIDTLDPDTVDAMDTTALGTKEVLSTDTVDAENESALNTEASQTGTTTAMDETALATEE